MTGDKNEYRCLTCGTDQGEPTSDNASETWWWRTCRFGKVGPFHNQACAERFEMASRATPRFTISEIEQMLVLQQSNRLAGDDDRRVCSVLIKRPEPQRTSS